MRTYGTLTREDTYWVFDVEPHVAVRLKRLFPRALATRSGTIVVAESDDVALDIEWSLIRWPLDVGADDLAHLTAVADRQRWIGDQIVSIFAGHPVDGDFRIPARAPRWDHQRTNADIVSVVKRLLITDSLGAGKSYSGSLTFRNPDALPGLVVAAPHLQHQWYNEIKATWPDFHVHVVTKGTPYDPMRTRLGRRHVRPPDVYVTTYSKLGGWSQHLAGAIRSVVFDEVQELRNGTSTVKGTAAATIADKANYVVGLSVGPDSVVEMIGGPFGTGWVGTIEEATRLVAKEVAPECWGIHELFRVEHLDVRSRGWTGERFGWKPVRTFLRHRCDTTTTTLRVPSGRLTLTDEHSVYRVAARGLDLVRADGLTPGDRLAGDDGNGWAAVAEQPFDFADLAADLVRGQVVVDTAGITRHDIGVTAWQWQNFHKEAKFGPRLPADIYRQHAALLPPPTGAYQGIGRGHRWIAASVNLSDWAYLLGFYLGDGWLDGTRVGLAVEDALAEHMMDMVANLPHVALEPKLRPGNGRSVEVRFSHPLFSEMLRRTTRGANCYDKFIPGEWIISWPETARRELLRGLVDSDGSVGRDGRRYYTTVSKPLATSLLSLLRSLGAQGSLSCRTGTGAGGADAHGRKIVGTRNAFSVNWSAHAESGDNFGWRGNRVRYDWGRNKLKEAAVRSVEADLESPDVVYDLEMVGHPSFVADGVLVHNTATPVTNYGGDLWEIYSIVRPDALGERHEFLREWCGSSYGGKPRVANPAALGSFLRDSGVMVGVKLPGIEPLRIEQVVDHDIDVYDQLSGNAAELARFILSQETPTTDRWQAAGELDVRLRQATGIAKAPYVAAFVELLLESVDKVVLWGWHHACYDIWMERLAKHRPVKFTGAESDTQKRDALDRFRRPNNEGGSAVFIMSLRSGAGLNGLQDVCHVGVFGELDWTPSMHAQCIGRLNRPGQENHPVLAYFLTSDVGSDLPMIEVLGVKKQQAEPIEDPSIERITPLMEVDADRVKMLARAVLEQAGEPIPTTPAEPDEGDDDGGNVIPLFR